VHTIEDIATTVGKSAETIRKSFFRATGVNLSQFISLARVEKMQRLLIETCTPCKTICFHVGCREDSGAKMFKRMVGMTMDEFRRMKQNDAAGRRREAPMKTTRSDLLNH